MQVQPVLQVQKVLPEQPEPVLAEQPVLQEPVLAELQELSGLPVLPVPERPVRLPDQAAELQTDFRKLRYRIPGPSSAHRP